MISKNVISLSSFGITGIPKEYNVQQWSACVNGLINEVDVNSDIGFPASHLLMENDAAKGEAVGVYNYPTIISSSNIDRVELNRYGIFKVTFTEPIIGKYMPFAYAYRQDKGNFSHISDLLFASYKNVSQNGLSLIFSSCTEPQGRREHNPGFQAPKSWAGIGSENNGFDYLSLVIFR